MKLQTPIDMDERVQAKVLMYEDTLKATPQVPIPPNPKDSPIPGVSYDSRGFPEMPEDLTAITLVELGKLFQAVTVWHEYLSAQVTNADHSKVVRKGISDLVKAEVKKQLREGGMSKAEADDVFRTDMRFIESDTNYIRAKVLADRMEDHKGIISKRFQLISREITRRTGEFHDSNMDPNNRFTGGVEGRKLK